MTLLAIALASPSFGQANCATRDEVLALVQQYGETRQSAGLSAEGVLIETFAAPGGSWTITATIPDGPTCLVASGGSFMPFAEPAGEAG